MAVVMFVGSSVVPQSVVILMLSVAVILGACLQWIASAGSRRTKFLRASLLCFASVGCSVYIVADCWVWRWLCLAI